MLENRSMRRNLPALSIVVATLFACAPAAQIDASLDGSSPVADAADARDASAATDALAPALDGDARDASLTDSALDAASVSVDANRAAPDATSPQDASMDASVDASMDAGQHSIACKNSDERSVRGGGTIARRQPRLEDGGEARGHRVADSGCVLDRPPLDGLSST
jgi:hypothetical protein